MLENMPKVELHVHLDGSLDIDLAKRLSLLDDDEIISNMIAKDKCIDLNDYLTKFSFPCSLMQSKNNLIKVAEALGKNFEKENVIYAEVRFAPLKHTLEGLSLDDVVTSVIEGFSNCKTKVNLILCMMRNDTFSDNLKVVDLAEKYLGNGVVALDLAGAEALYPTADFAELFSIVKSKNIPFTIHAGEADGVSSINAAIDIGTMRIGHGIRCLEDNETVNLIKEKEILLEVCPTSNVQTNVVDTISNHPIGKLKDMGIKVCINTDNRTVSNTTLSKEYKLLQDELGFTFDDLVQCNVNAINGSFLSKEEKRYLLQKYYSFIIKN